MNTSNLNPGKNHLSEKELLEAIASQEKWHDVARIYIEQNADSLNAEDIVDVLRASLSRSPHHRQDIEIRGDEIRLFVKQTTKELELNRTKEQKALNALIASGGESNDAPQAGGISVDELIRKYALITDGSRVIEIHNPINVYSYNDFENRHAASRSISRETGRPVSNARLWLQHKRRKTFNTLTFKPGGPLNVLNPQGIPSLNLWRPRNKVRKPEDYEILIAPFIEHIQWLFGELAESFLNWLAHLEQKPGELPHHHYLHIAKHHGMGRNWIMGVLARVWRGYVAPAFDLMGVLESGFNARLSQCLLACVDEINETGGLQWKHANALRQLLTADQREINPKYGRRWVEYVYTRFLLFSNHGDALPLAAEDRRIIVVETQSEPKAESYYKQLYALLNNPAFIDSVITYLQVRDISDFNPGMRAPMTEAKRKLVEFAKSDYDRICEALVARWPVDVIYLSEVKELLRDPGDPISKPLSINQAALTHSFTRAGIQRYAACDQIRDGHGRERAWILRNHAVWQAAGIDQIRNERNRIDLQAKEAALYGDQLSANSLPASSLSAFKAAKLPRVLPKS